MYENDKQLYFLISFAKELKCEVTFEYCGGSGILPDGTHIKMDQSQARSVSMMFNISYEIALRTILLHEIGHLIQYKSGAEFNIDEYLNNRYYRFCYERDANEFAEKFAETHNIMYDDNVLWYGVKKERQNLWKSISKWTKKEQITL